MSAFRKTGRAFSPIIHALALSAALLPLKAAVDYTKEIKPILSEHCYQCHGGTQQKSGLRLDTAKSAIKGGEHGAAINPGQAASSLLIKVVKGEHESLPRMPYKKEPLVGREIDLLMAWINEGAVAPAGEKPQVSTHWAFIPPKRPELPKVGNPGEIRNPIDQFVQARLEKEHLKPSPAADRITLLRRLSLDLIGLPPTIKQVDAFLKDTSPEAYDHEVDRLLASAHFGERWGRWWLDAARYADSNGYSIDSPRQIWKYRDWVVDAINRDLPFNEFALEQLAGDLLPHPTLEQKIATGFNRNTQINQEGGIDPEQFRVESVMDRVSTFGTVFLGLTIGCAQCHDHKFDPISQKEYYQLFAFFNNTIQDGHGDGGPKGVMEIPTPREVEARKHIDQARTALENYLDSHADEVNGWEKSLDDPAKKELPTKVVAALKIPIGKRSLGQKREVYKTFNPQDSEFKALESKLRSLEKTAPKPITTLVMEELKTPRKSFILTKGDFTRPGLPVTPGVPSILPPLKSTKAADQLNRLDLARWLEDPRNPLTARVIVNRIWQQYFGKGLVETENDFGTQGSRPTHPLLLDWLACEFMNPSAPGVKPWSMKHIHRLIVTSATYRQSSRSRKDLETIDPGNRLLARQSRLRLDAEIVRDAALEASGLLCEKLGGPPVYPPQPDGVMNLGQVKRPWKVSKGEDRYRRGIYTHYWRATPHPALAVFDAPDSFSTCTRRLRSNTPLQALTLLNDAQFYEFAAALADRILADPADTRLDKLFRYCVARHPTPQERQRLSEFLQLQTEESEKAKWTAMARVVLNLDETITRE
jgi:hypothetical protein